MSFSFDEGAGAGSEGPWLLWTARGTLDGEIGPKSFIIRTKEDKKTFSGFDRGVVLDIDNMKTGWCYTEGVVGSPPDWKWNQSLATFAPKPGDLYKKGFSIPCAISKEETATWEQSGIGAWNAFVALVPSLQQRIGDELPLVKMAGTKVEKFTRGSTVTPILEIVKWVQRPACLDEDVTGIATEEPAPKPTAKPEQVTADSSEF